jgi:hypothetical protein
LDSIEGSEGYPELFPGTGLQQMNFYCDALGLWVALVPQKTGIDRGAGAIEMTPEEFAQKVRGA